MDETRLPPPTGEGRDLLERLLTRAEAMGPAPPEGIPTGDSPAGDSSTGNSPTGGGGSPAAGSDPSALLAALPALMSAFGPLLGDSAPAAGRGSTTGEGAPPVGVSPPVGIPRSRGGGMNRHTALLCAVKPYLTPQRQEAADTILRFCRLWDSLAASGLLEALPALLSPMGGVTPTEGGESRVQ